MSNYASIKLSTDLVEDARREAEVLHRSVGAQVEHWAKLGRAIENTEGFGIDRVRAALAGRLQLDDLSVEAQAQALDGLDAAFAAPDALTQAHFAELGARPGAVGGDGKGGVVRRQTAGRLRRAG